MHYILPAHFSNQLQYHRAKMRYRQVDLALLTGINRRRISKLELRDKAATTGEARTLARALGFSSGVTQIVSRRPPSRTLLPVQRLYIPPSDRPFQVRLNEARRQHPQLLQELEDLIIQREDASELIAFLQDVPVDSSLEVIVVMKFLAAGAKTAYDSPGRYGFCGGLPVIEPLHRTPITAWHRPMFQLGRLVGFFQVCFEVSRVTRVDLLICHAWQPTGAPTWLVVEVDGEGHKDIDDSREQLPFPVLRFTEAEVLGRDFAQRFLDRIESSIPQVRAA